MKDRLIVLGGNPETASFVKRLKELNIHTIVIDPNINAPAKNASDESYEVEVLDTDALLNLLKKKGFQLKKKKHGNK